MQIKLEFNSLSHLHCSIRSYDEELDDITSIFHDVCTCVAQDVKFLVGGFGIENWPVDVQFDLPIVLEQLPDVITALRSHERTEIDFFEQGIQKTVVLEPTDINYRVICFDKRSGGFLPERLYISKEDLTATLVKLVSDFLAIVSAAAPELLNHAWLQAWAQGAKP